MLKATVVSRCPNCNAETMAHMACRECGFYGGKKVNAPKTKAVVTRA
jgi:ribosomal protein L32